MPYYINLIQNLKEALMQVLLFLYRLDCTWLETSDSDPMFYFNKPFKQEPYFMETEF